jgi:hypothetical protein
MSSVHGERVAALCDPPFECGKPARMNPHANVVGTTRRAVASPGAVTLPEGLT